MNNQLYPQEGLLLVDKPAGCTSFHLVSLLRKKTGIQTIGHAGTLDPFATGVMVLLIGRQYTKRSEEFLSADKTYTAVLHLGIETDSYDSEGRIVSEHHTCPNASQVQEAIASFQGESLQIPPMFSAKKIKGQKLYELARKGIVVERSPVKVKMQIQIIRYDYPQLELQVDCSKGTYIRSLAHDVGRLLGCGAHLTQLTRTRSGSFHLSECISYSSLQDTTCPIQSYIKTN